MSREEKLEYLSLLQEKYRRLTAWQWDHGDLHVKLHSGQREVLDQLDAHSRSREALIFCARQWGKSFFGIIYALRFCIMNPYRLVRIAAPTLKQANDIVADTLETIAKDAPPGFIIRQKSALKWFVGGHSSLRLGVLERAHVDSLRGAMAHLVIAEEGGFVKSEDYEYAVRSVLTPQLLHSSGRLIHITTPSEDPEHYIHKEVLPRCQSLGTYFKYDIYSNPRINSEQIEQTKALLGGEHSISWRREALVEIVRDSNFVCVPEFDVAKHVRKFPLPAHSYLMTSIDFGGVRDKTVALCLTYDFLNARILAYDERVFDPNTDTATVVSKVKRMENKYQRADNYRVKDRIADAPGQVLVDLRDKHKYEVLPPFKDSFEAGVNVVRHLLNTKKLFIHQRCAFLIATLLGASYNKTRTDFSRTEFLGHMDALAALIYGCRMIDKTTNPYPEIPRNIQENFYVKPKQSEDELEKLADLFVPWRKNPREDYGF